MSPATREPRMVRHGVRAVRVCALIATGLLAWRVEECVLDCNLAAVAPGEVYRSGQFTGPELRHLIDQIGLRSVVNLRGENDEPWYRDEVAACSAAGVRLYNVAMSGRELPEPQTVGDLIDVLREAPRPMLLHCQGGTDRVGLAATLFLTECKGATLDEAWEKGLSLWHGHVAIGGAAELDRFLALYRAQGRGKSLERWAREDYPAIFTREWNPADPPPLTGPGASPNPEERMR